MSNAVKKLKVSDVRWRGYAFMDVNFRTFYYENSFYRATLPTAINLVKDNSFQFLLNSLAKDGFIPETTQVPIEIEGFGKIYKQHTEFFNVPMSYANPIQLKEAALLFINLCKSLHKKNLCLIDGHCYNIIVQGLNKPLWCDVGSIIPSQGENYFNDIVECIKFMIYPLLLRSKSFDLGDMMRHCTTAGITNAAAGALRLATPKTFSPKRGEALNELEKFVQDIDFPWEKTLWSNYHDSKINNDDIDTKIVPHAPNRDALITRLLKLLKPKTVVDIAANAGVFSRLAARLGAEVLAIEPDETAVASGHLYLREHGAANSVKFMVAGADGNLKQPADVALALALTHHLFLTNHHPWKLIVRYLSGHTNKHLITEFMPNGLMVHEKQPNLPANYTLELFVEQLERYFSKVEIIEREVPKGSANRILILCTDKRTQPIDDNKNFLC